MATLQTLNDWEAGWIVRWKINDNFTAVNSDLATLDTNKLEASDIATINWNTISAGGNLVIPVLTDWDKGDITLTSSGTVWTIDNNVVTNAKLWTTATNTIKWRSTAWTGNVEDLTPTQVAWMLPVATTSVAGTMSASDKTKLDWLSLFKLNWTAQVTGYSLVQSNSWTYTTYSDVITPSLTTCAYITMTSWSNWEIWFQKYVWWTWVDMTASIWFWASLIFFPILEWWVSFRFKWTTYATWTSVSWSCNITV